MVLYLLICLVSILAGCGILTLIGVEVDRRSTLSFAPVITLCSLALFMGGLVAGGFTIGEITPTAYALCFGAAVLGAIRCGKTVLESWRSFGILAGLPLLILFPAIVEGIENYSGGLGLDGWSYVTVGQSLQQYPLGAEGWLPLGTQFSASLGKTRFISIGFLALLAPLCGEHNDTQEVLGPYFGWLFFVYASACFFFAKAARLTRPAAWIFIFVAMLSGWNLKTLNANSLDNCLALCFLPAVLGILILIPGPSIRHGIVLGAIWAAGLYAYPESSAFTFAAILAMGAQRLIAVPRQLDEFRNMSVAFFMTVAACVLPYAPEIALFFRQQVTAATAPAGSRAGEGFYQLLSTPGYILPSYWGLTPDFFAQRYTGNFDHYAVVTAYILTLALLVGMFLLVRRRDWSLPLFAGGMTIAYAVALIHFRYPYGAYKILVLSWFVIAYAVVVAAEWARKVIERQSLRWMAYTGAALGLGLLAAIGGFFILQERIFYNSLPFKSVREFRKISVLENLAQGQPVAMIVNDTYANVWAVHFLRKTKLYLADEYRGYMAGKEALLDRSDPVEPADIRFVVTENAVSFNAERLLSKAGPYYMWDCGHSPWALVVSATDHPNGTPSSGSADAISRTGRPYTEIQILSRTAAQGLISAEFALGAGVAKTVQQRVRVATTGGLGEERIIGDGMHSFVVPLQSGLNRMLLGSVEKVPLLVRVGPVSVATVDDSTQIRDIENPDGLEKWGDDPFFWVGSSDTSITISAAAAGVAELRATLLPGPSLMDKSQARLWIVSPSGGKVERDLGWGPAKIDIPVQAGPNRVTIRAIGPVVKVSGDSRIMMIGFRNYQASSGLEFSKRK